MSACFRNVLAFISHLFLPWFSSRILLSSEGTWKLIKSDSEDFNIVTKNCYT